MSGSPYVSVAEVTRVTVERPKVHLEGSLAQFYTRKIVIETVLGTFELHLQGKHAENLDIET